MKANRPVGHRGLTAGQWLEYRRESGSSCICLTFMCRYQGVLSISSAETIEMGWRVVRKPSKTGSFTGFCGLEITRRNTEWSFEELLSDREQEFSGRGDFLPWPQGTFGSVWSHPC